MQSNGATVGRRQNAAGESDGPGAGPDAAERVPSAEAQQRRTGDRDCSARATSTAVEAQRADIHIDCPAHVVERHVKMRIAKDVRALRHCAGIIEGIDAGPHRYDHATPQVVGRPGKILDRAAIAIYVSIVDLPLNNRTGIRQHTVQEIHIIINRQRARVDHGQIAGDRPPCPIHHGSNIQDAAYRPIAEIERFERCIG